MKWTKIGKELLKTSVMFARRKQRKIAITRTSFFFEHLLSYIIISGKNIYIIAGLSWTSDPEIYSNCFKIAAVPVFNLFCLFFGFCK